MEDRVDESGQGGTDIVAPDRTPAGPPAQKPIGGMEVSANFVTARSVQVPRDLERIVDAVKREAKYAMEGFFFRYPIGGGFVEGPTIGAIMAVAREWGNCAFPPPRVEFFDNGNIGITAAFADLERGFTSSRTLIYKPTEPPQKFAKSEDSRERWKAMQFGAAQSRAMRNVGKDGVPAWLVQQAVEIAKQAAVAGITKDSIEVSLKKAVDSLAELLGVPVADMQEAVRQKLEHSLALVTTDDILVLRSAYATIKLAEDKQMVAASIFPVFGQDANPAGDAPTTGEVGAAGKRTKGKPKTEHVRPPAPDPLDTEEGRRLLGMTVDTIQGEVDEAEMLGLTPSQVTLRKLAIGRLMDTTKKQGG